MDVDPRDQWVLLIGGPSGSGKTTVADAIGRRFSIPWLMVDDLRLAFQYSQVALPTGTDALYFFADIDGPKRHVWRASPERLRDALIAVGNVMAPAIEIVILHHLDQRRPIVIEGDGILPSLLTRPRLQDWMRSGNIRAVFITEPDDEVLLRNMLARGRGVDAMSMDNMRTEVRAKALFSYWVETEARRLDLPVVSSCPLDNLVQRILTVAGSWDV